MRVCLRTSCACWAVYDRGDAARRNRYRDAFTIALAVLPALFYWLFTSPVQMVVAGGLAQMLMLPLIGLAVVYLRHAHLPRELAPSTADDDGVLGVDGRDGQRCGVHVWMTVAT